MIFRSQKLMRASTRVLKGVVTYQTARYKPGDEICCPPSPGRRWAGTPQRRMRVVERETFAPPPEAQAPAAPDAAAPAG